MNSTDDTNVMPPPVRIFFVDYSETICRMLRFVMSVDLELHVCGSARNGVDAVSQFPTTLPDVILLDVEPLSSGNDTVGAIRNLDPDIPIIMFCTLAVDTEATVDALTRGANDYVPKPSVSGHINDAVTYLKSTVIPKLKRWGRWFQGLRQKRLLPAQITRDPLSVPHTSTPRSHEPIEVVGIGISTGGPSALAQVLKEFPANFDVPILITQHMPIHCTRFLAERLNNICQLQVREGAEGSVLGPGQAWIAPGDQHMVTRRNRSNVTLHLTNAPPENSCRPSADVMFRSIAKTYHNRCLAVVMTGMGKDGLDGCQEIKWHGGRILVQDEETSVAWGMPRAVIKSDLAERIVPLAEMAHAITSIVTAQNVRERRNLITT